MTQATEFRKVQSAILANRTACWICSNYFDRKRGEMTWTRARVFVGMVGTMEETPTFENYATIKDTRKPVFSEKAYLVCIECEATHREDLATMNLYADQRYHSEKKDSDLLWEEA